MGYSSDQVQGGNILLGRGKIYFDRLTTAGAKTGLRFLGNCTKFELTTSDELKEKFSSASKDSPLLVSVNIRRTIEAGITIDEFDEWNQALGLMANEPGEFTQSASSVVDEVVGPVKRGRWFQLGPAIGGARNISSVVVTSSPAGTTYVLNTDYREDLVAGRIYIMPTGTIPDTGVNLLVDYTRPAITAGSGLPKVSGGSAGKIEGHIQFISDPATGPLLQVDIWKASITPDGAVGFISEEFGEFSVKAKVLDDAVNHAGEPLYRVLRVA